MIRERKTKSDFFGTHQVRDSKKTLPQSAESLDSSLPIYSNEILIEVERLNIDAASFVQMEQQTGGNKEKIAEIILENCHTRGKQQNRVTGSGGMLVGTVKQIGSRYQGALKLKQGDRVATLVSLTLTPLHLESIRNIDLKTHQIEATGHAILFESGIAAKLPKNLPEKLAMALFDVAGAPALVHDTLRKNQSLLVIGAGGKAGTLSCAAGRQKVGRHGKVYGIERNPVLAKELKSLSICDEVWSIDATDALAVHKLVEKTTRGKMIDVVINVASVPNTEVSALVSAHKSGKIIFFSMATSFTKVTLGAEGIGTSAQLLFGNGYFPNHSDFVVALVTKQPRLERLFRKRYDH